MLNSYSLRKNSLVIKRIKPYMGAANFTAVESVKNHSIFHSSISHIVNNFPGIVSWKDCDSSFLGCNDRLAKLANLSSPNKIFGKYDDDMPWGDDGYSTIFREEDQEVITEGTINFVLGKYKFFDTEKVVLTQKTPLLNPQGNVMGIINYLTEIAHFTVPNIIQTLINNGIQVDDVLMGHIRKLFIDNGGEGLLSPREEECLCLLVNGLTAKHIGKRLGLSYRTVEFYITGIKKKLGCNKLSSLITKAIKLGYMTC